MIDGKMLILGRPCTTGASRWLRTEQHLVQLVKQDLAHCPVIYGDEEEEDVWKAMCLADVFTSGATPTPKAASLAEEWIKHGKPWVWDIDDDPMNINPTNPAYAVYGLEEVELKDVVGGTSWLWKDGFANFHLEANRERHASFMSLLSKMSAITTTTQYLADKLKRYFPTVPILIRPNYLDFSETWTRKAKQSRDGKIRIMYQGGSSHTEDLDSILPALKTIADRYPHVIFLFIGDSKAHAEKMLPKDRIEEVQWCDYSTYALLMAKLNPDIAIAPLCMSDQNAEFNRCKSSLKWLDAAAVGIPCVCQWDTPYQEVVNFGQVPDVQWNGVLAKTVDDWIDALSVLIENRDARETIGANAYEEAVTTWSAELHAETHLSEYEEVVNGDHGSCN